MQSLNFSLRPALPSTTTIMPPSKQPTNESPPSRLLPVLPPRHPSPSSLLVFSSRLTRCTTSPCSLISRGRMECCLEELILQKSGILKHSEASLATSMAELRLLVRPCGLAKVLSMRPISFAYFFMSPKKTAMLFSLFSLARSKQLKQRLIFFLSTQLPRLLAMVRATLLQDFMMRAQRASQSVIKVYSQGSSASLVPPTLLSLGVTRRSKLLTVMKYSLMISQAVQKVSSLEMLATWWGCLYLYPLMMVCFCMLQMIHFLAVMWLRVTSLSILSLFGMSDCASFIRMGCGNTALVSSGRHSFSVLSCFELMLRSRTNSQGLSCIGFRWKIVLWKRVVSQRRCFLKSGRGSYDIVCSFFIEKLGSMERRDLPADASVLSERFLLAGLDYIIIISVITSKQAVDKAIRKLQGRNCGSQMG